MRKNKVKKIAFYLPQFHCIPENDKAYGKGFTEWTNTKKALPLFNGHYQPKTPMNKNYYCLLDDGVMENQAKLAMEYGIDGFCYYHYWFKDGKKLLEKPLEMMLENKNISIPFCICWANENWTKRWDGGNNEVIVEQDYGDMNDLENHMKYLEPFFKDERYIKEDGKPIFIIYKPELIPNLKKIVTFIRKSVRKMGFNDVILLTQFPTYYIEHLNRNLFDGFIQFQPTFVHQYEEYLKENKVKKTIKYVMNRTDCTRKIFCYLKKFRKSCIINNKLKIRNYCEDWQKILNYEVMDDKIIAGAFVDWDNTARNKNGLLYQGANPSDFGRFMKLLIDKVKKEYTRQYIFINAWNEWAEGAFLEPDEKYKYSYLEAFKEACEGEVKK